MPTLTQLYADGKFKDALRFPKTIRPKNKMLRIAMKTARVKLHSLLPETTMWTYGGHFPGPTVEIAAGEETRVEWVNSLTGKIPVTSAHVLTTDDDPASNHAGAEPADIDHEKQGLDAFTVVHLHGARSAADSDGWTENVSATGQSAFASYAFSASERGAMYWYHDHAMSVTRLNVYAGLAGLWMLRDQADAAVLKAFRQMRPRGCVDPAPVEIPLLIQDRNLETEPDGKLTGRLLHKVEDKEPAAGGAGPLEFFGPLTLVNGVVWPHQRVARLAYRLRVINGSNARIYRLQLRDAAGNSMDHLLRQIGTDGGLLAAPVALPAGGLVLAPAERADLVLDLSALPAGVKRLVWLNTAEAPFSNSTEAATPEQKRLVYPEVMEFRVAAGKVAGAKPLSLPAPLSDFRTLTHADLPEGHQHRLVALVEDGMLTLRELQRTNLAPGQASKENHLKIQYDIETNSHDHIVVYEMLPATFRDTINYFPNLGSTEAWKFLNLTGDTHPMHIHLVQYQISSREQYEVPDPPLEGGEIKFTAPAPIDGNERGWKDTIRVNPNEMVSLLVPFRERCGRYMYHCHILEHEDYEMMRPFVVLPAALNMHAGEHHMAMGAGGHP